VSHDDPDEPVVLVYGDLDIATTPTLATCLSTLLRSDTPCRGLVVDLSASAFVDVGGATLLLNAHRCASDRGTALCLRGCSTQLVRLLHVIHILDVVALVPAQRTCNTVVGEALGNSAQMLLPSGYGITPQREDRAATTCSPRPRRAAGSTGRACGGEHG
jgi:anti-anti-sigma factor